MTNPPAESPPSANSGRSNRPLRGIAFMASGVLALSLMDAISKFVIAFMPSIQIMAIRSVLVLAALLAFVAVTGQVSSLRTRRPWGHALRGIISVGSMLCFFESLRLLPLATSIAISFASPLIMTAFSVVLLKERVGIHRWTAVGVGFAGVAIIVGPEASDGILSMGAAFAMSSAVLYALGLTTVRWLASTETEISMMVTQCFFQLAIGWTGTLLLPGGMAEMPQAVWFGIAGMSMFLIAGQFLTFRAFRLAPVGAVAPFHYTELVWATLIGWFFWDELPPSNTWYGAAIVVAAGLYVIWRERVRAREAAAAAG
ncbi:MAG: EamA family transporter [Alphaproteobacteria bacterium]|nr:EamA family transporter [Alphaproteobacteria bacterium]